MCCRLCPLLLLDQEKPQLQDTGEAKLWKTERKEPGKPETLLNICLQFAPSVVDKMLAISSLTLERNSSIQV